MKVLVDYNHGAAIAVAPTISVAFVDLMDNNPDVNQDAATKAALDALRWWDKQQPLVHEPAYPKQHFNTFGDFHVIVDPTGSTEL